MRKMLIKLIVILVIICSCKFNYILAQVHESTNVDIYKYISQKYPPAEGMKRIDLCKQFKTFKTDSMIRIQQGKKFKFIIDNKTIRKHSFIINGQGEDSIFPGNVDNFENISSYINYDLYSICYFKSYGHNYFLVPWDNHGCNGVACHYLMFYLIDYNDQEKLFKVFFFSTNFSRAFHFTNSSNKLEYFDIVNSTNDDSLLDLVNPKDVDSIKYVYYFIIKFVYSPQKAKWTKEVVVDAFRAKSEYSDPNFYEEISYMLKK